MIMLILVGDLSKLQTWRLRFLGDDVTQYGGRLSNIHRTESIFNLTMKTAESVKA